MTRKIEYSKHVRIDFLILVCVILLVGLQPAFNEIKSSRWYRDVVNLTPFDQAAVTLAIVEPYGIIVSGVMRKRRCVFSSLTAYLVMENGVSVRFPVDTSFEDKVSGVKGNRPRSSNLQKWGPWKILYVGGLGKAERYEIYAHHTKCPFGPADQTNLFVDGEWGTTIP